MILPHTAVLSTQILKSEPSLFPHRRWNLTLQASVSQNPVCVEALSAIQFSEPNTFHSAI